MPKATKATESKSEPAQEVAKSEQEVKKTKKVSTKQVQSTTASKPEPEPEPETKPETKNKSKGNKEQKVSKSEKSEKSKSVKQVQETVVVQETPEVVHTEQSTEVLDTTSELKFASQYVLIHGEVNAMRKQIGNLSVTLRKLESAYNADIKKVRKTKQKRNAPHKATGFAKPKAVPEKLAKFIGVNPGTELTGPQVTKKVWSQLKEKGLTYENDKRVFRTNAEVSELFNVPKSVNKSVDHKDKAGFNFCNLQKFIANALR